ncbi:hypothetical protein RHGRI_022018 [Rhododendron griersonianum]|uniref:Maf-like protein n=1 Tax=Rhododendron griersonianum TaxID=479676 RepID=A0AAV6JNN1_9ERIC|nr:hypothetical protein RHGRI_022018 [Rhododendron griersonianum]
MEATASKFKIILGSSSVHRRKVLAEMGCDFTIMTADIDEKSIKRDTPEEMVMAIAEAKAEAIIAKLPIDYCKQDAEPPLLITGYSRGTAGTVSSVLVTNLKTGLRKGDWEKAELEADFQTVSAHSGHVQPDVEHVIRVHGGEENIILLPGGGDEDEVAFEFVDVVVEGAVQKAERPEVGVDVEDDDVVVFAIVGIVERGDDAGVDVVVHAAPVHHVTVRWGNGCGDPLSALNTR